MIKLAMLTIFILADGQTIYKTYPDEYTCWAVAEKMLEYKNPDGSAKYKVTCEEVDGREI